MRTVSWNCLLVTIVALGALLGCDRGEDRITVGLVDEVAASDVSVVKVETVVDGSPLQAIFLDPSRQEPDRNTSVNLDVPTEIDVLIAERMGQSPFSLLSMQIIVVTDKKPTIATRGMSAQVSRVRDSETGYQVIPQVLSATAAIDRSCEVEGEILINDLSAGATYAIKFSADIETRRRPDNLIETVGARIQWSGPHVIDAAN